MAAFKDLTGAYLGEWLVLTRAANSKAGKSMWNCRCKCGAEKVIVSGSLMSGKSRMCRRCSSSNEVNALHLKSIKPNFTTHGMCGTRFYNIWSSIIERCKPCGHKNYGGRGITVCDRWRTFENFYTDMFLSYAENLTIDRIDNNGNYELGNCRWATMKQQANNTRRSRLLVYKGRTQTLMQWCEGLSLSYHMVKRRLYKGWSVEDAFEKEKQTNQFG